MKRMSSTRFPVSALFAGALISVAGLLTAQANTIVTFSVDMGAATFVPGTDTVSVHGTFDGWTTGLNLVQQGSSTVYTNTANNTTDANGGTMYYKFVNSNAAYGGTGGYENLYDGGANRCVILPTANGTSISLPTPFYAETGTGIQFTNTLTFQVDMSQQINLGNFIPGTSTVDVSGKFNDWGQSVALTNDPSIVRVNQFGLASSNVYTGVLTPTIAVSTNAHIGYQFVINGTSYEGVSGPNSDEGGNRFFTMINSNQVFPVVDYHEAAYAPIVTNIQFSVDMSIVAITDTNFNPASVTLDGDLTGWGDVTMTNNPTAANTNIFTATTAYSEGVGSTVNYQYRYRELSDNSTSYDHANGVNGGQNNRQITIPNVSNTNFLSTFNDASVNDYIFKPTAVFFSVDMSGAIGTENHTFDPVNDAVYINGTFANWYAWAGGVNPVPAPGSATGPGNAAGPYLMVEQGTSTIYTNTLIVPPGPSVLSYKYGLDAFELNGGPSDDEAASGLNHGRVIRSTAFNPYVMPQDKFGNQYNEPYFNSANTAGGRLTVGAVSAGKVPVQWLGRPGAHLQVKSSLTSGSWVDLPQTDGTNWSSGFSSTNGFVSQTNWPASGTGFFRLVKP